MTTTDNNWRDDLESVEPHFNDERTIRSAQPVVPLDTVIKERRHRRLILAGAFVIASLLGSTAALALIRVRQASVSVDDTEATVEAKTSEEAEAQAAQTTEPETTEPIVAAEEVPTEVVETEPAKRKKPRKHAAPPRVSIMVNTNPSASNGEARMVDQWEERRQRRVSRPRDPQQNHHSDLFRIREIFEGPRRPRRTNN